MSKKEKKLPLTLGLIAIVNLAPVLIWRGYILQTMWGWFLVRLGLPVIGIAEAIGVSLTISYLVGTGHIHTVIQKLEENDDEEDEVSNFMGKILSGWFGPGLVLFMGWILTHWL